MRDGESGGAGPSPFPREKLAFDAASRQVVDYLTRVAPMGAWAVTRVVEGRQTMLVTTDRSYGYMQPGASFPYATSMCREMAATRTPRVVVDTRATPELADAQSAADALSVPVGAYVGTPIVGPDGALFGTVCGYDQQRMDPATAPSEDLLDLLSGLLSAVLEVDLVAADAAREKERAASEAETDPLTGLLNRRGWDRWLEREEDRFRRFGDPASVVMLDLDRLKQVNDAHGHDAGDRHLCAAADALRSQVRDSDALARLGGDEFALVVRVGPDGAQQLVDRLEAALGRSGVLGSFGVAPYSVVSGFPGAVAEADAAMYEVKHERRRAWSHEAGPRD